MKKWMKSLTAVMVAVSLIGGASSAVEAKSNLKGNIVINGSSALLPLTLQAASEFKKENPKVKISASAAGSITGPQSVRKGIADIGAVDWDASKNVPGFNKFDGLVANPVAVTVFTAVANPNVGVNSLTTKQLQDIFSGKVTNWKEVGGSDAKIVVVNRKFGSGTRVNFQQKALDGKEFMNKGDNYKEVGSSGDMKTTIETTPNAIGYIDLPYVTSKMKALSINGVAPTEKNVLNGSYKVWGIGYYMTKGQPTGATKAFIEYIQSSKFQNGSLKKLKFIPLSAVK
ncbi:phosphate binding protein [Paenibacillus vortex V453]|jgi:phosphate transport system substrate-binding protein|uniref:Phosphate ABC transporter substrate-binding protein n=3 Tax=Paenibacillus TaxID=44249 RepID=A0A163JCS7_9BACL|nr:MULTISPECIES: phosphate ABC transporter substrate-binding protein [Paenibacillus]AWP30033.1 phosphate ABC transporter substrate-binding protein [Paenibacillus sp. Cedars]EFU43227.1 phosphate binding protein [Paenibacillus vortex V453]KZS46509.1 phosphate ABC transporter substrate-binding protein [Paenibacillus glucanolyticus]MDH6671293.1 phosphate transport system substrate-binding protein [Paenibacillus sp. LBL]MPY15762.1 phosphate ABC transporter substrate-binding protein [Paenibacillus g